MSVRPAILLAALAAAVAPPPGGFFAAPAAAQTARPATATGGAPPAAATTDAAGAAAPGAPAAEAPPNVDESALRYFAREGDLDRLESEIRRLKTLYPTWQPPDDLLQAKGPRRDETQPIWDLFAAGRYAEAREAITRRQAQEPTWQPPAELVAKIAEAETRLRLVNASDAHQWNTVLSLATEAPGMLVCANMDVLWRVGEAFAKIGRTDRARDLYTYILQNCDDPQERVATVERAAELLPPDAVAGLMRLARTKADGSDEFATVRIAEIRRMLGAANADPSIAVPGADLEAFEAAARNNGEPGDAVLLAFYLYAHGEPQAAIEWFQAALQRGAGAKAAEGYVLAMRAAGRDLEAEPIAYEWRTSSDDSMIAYLVLMTAALTTDLAGRVDQPMVARFAQVVEEKHSALGAQALGWYAYNTGQLAPAATWFANSLRWEPSEVAAFGLAVTFQRARDVAALDRLLTQWTPVYPRLPALLQAPASAPAAGAQSAAPSIVGTPLSSGAQAPVAYSAAAGTAAAGALPGIAAPAPSYGTGVPARAGGVPIVPAGQAPGARAPQYQAAPAAAPGDAAQAPAVSPVRAAPAAPRPAPGGCAAIAAVGTMSAAAALRTGWCLMELDRPAEAVVAFNRATTAGGASPTTSEAAYGKSLAYLRLGLTDEGAVAAAQAPQTRQRRIDLGEQILNQRAIAAYQAGRYNEALILMNERNRLVPETYDLMMLRGWAYLNLGRFDEARQLFEAVDGVRPSDRTREALMQLNKKTSRPQR